MERRRMLGHGDLYGRNDRRARDDSDLRAVGVSGPGSVIRTAAGISFGSDCNENCTSGTSVTLTAAPASGSVFSGWGGACAGTGGCTVAMSAAKSVTATFTANSLPKIYQ